MDADLSDVFNDGGPNASFKSFFSREISKWRRAHRPLPGSEAAVKMTRVDFNAIFVEAWLGWSAQQELERSAGSNSITTAWEGCGLYPYNREPPYWKAAIAAFGQREGLAKLAASETDAPAAQLGEWSSTSMTATPSASTLASLADAFAIVVSPTPSLTDSCAGRADDVGCSFRCIVECGCESRPVTPVAWVSRRAGRSLGGCASLRVAWGCASLRVAWGCAPLRVAWACCTG